MQRTIDPGTAPGLSALGLGGEGRLHRNPSVAALYEHALRRGEGVLAADGQFVVRTGHRTARSPQDKFFVREPGSDSAIDWNESNRPFDAGAFDALFERVAAYLSERECFALDAYAMAGGPEQLGLRIVTDLAWHALFARNLFVVPQLAAHDFTADFTIVDAADFQAEPARDGTRSETFVLIHFGRRLVLIGGTHFAGELKKAAFTVVNYLAPLRGLLPMHCSASAGPSGRTALFFGVSGSGKTTLAADPDRSIIGDDEHVWSASGITNVEAGCYAGALDLSPRARSREYRDYGQRTIRVPARRHTRSAGAGSGELPGRHRHACLGCIRRLAAARAPHARPGNVLLSQRLHGRSAAGPGTGTARAVRDLFELLR